MSSAILAHKHKRLTVATSSILIHCVFCLTTVHTVAEAPHKTDAELTEVLIGTWELVPSLGLFFQKTFLVFNAHGVGRALGIGIYHGAPRRGEAEVKWRVTNAVLTVEKTDPAKFDFQLHDQIVSNRDDAVLLRGDKGASEMHRISHLPALPPPLTSSEISAAMVKQITISSPQPDYPLAARQNRVQGRGIFRLVLTKDGRVDSIQVIKSTDSKMLDDAAEKALRQWRFKPGVMREVTIPTSFVLGRSRAR